MSRIEELLDFRISDASLPEHSTRIITRQLSNLYESRIAKLKAISKKIDSSIIDDEPANGIRDVYLKFTSNLSENNEVQVAFDRRELRALSYAFNYNEYQSTSIFDNPIYLEEASDLLNENWRDRYISGLLHCYLSNWKTDKRKSLVYLSSFIFDRISNYKGTRKTFLNFKKNTKFFEFDKGDVNLGYTLALENVSILNATDYLGLPDDWVSYPYFAGVINAYFEQSKSKIEEELDKIEMFLEAHSNRTSGTPTNKLIISKIILESENHSDVFKDRVKDIAFRLVGDPGDVTLWRPTIDSPSEEKNIINDARIILNQWLTRQFINVFFEKCIDDTRRKRFWLKHAKDISSFKVFGPVQTKRILKSDERIGPFVDGRYSVTASRMNVSAFIIYLKNHVLIEFSQDGYAFIGYQRNSRWLPDLSNRINSVNDLRAGHLPLAVKRKYQHIQEQRSEGRLLHQDGTTRSGSTLHWEDIFDYWLKRHVL